MFRKAAAAFCFVLLSAAVSVAGESWAPDGVLFGQTPYAPELEPKAEAPVGSLSGLGEKLFFDPKLSGSGRTACATCHDPGHGFAQAQPTPTFDGGRIGPRNAPSLLEARFFPRLMLDGRFRSLEEQVHGPLSALGEMGLSIEDAADRLAADPRYERAFVHILGEPPSPKGIGAAIAAFERTLVTGWSRFDKFSLKGEQSALSGFERFGFELFTGKGGCASCHRLPEREAKGGYALFTDFGFHNTGIGFDGRDFADAGAAKVTGRVEQTGAFRTPTLRNVAVTAPYMHDGSLPTLRAVVEFYNAGGQRNPFLSPLIHPLYLSDEEKGALVAFLNSLTTADFAVPRYRLPPQAAADFQR